MPSEMKRLKQPEEENGKLKRIVADLALDKEMLQDVIKRKRPARRREAVDRMRATWRGEHPADLFSSSSRAIQLPLQG
jgi:hypothetical protein